MFLVIFTTHMLNCVTLKCVSISVIFFNVHSDPGAETLFVLTVCSGNQRVSVKRNSLY